MLKFKKDNPDKVVLLFGNHDFSYIENSICESRMDYANWDRLNGMYFDNIKSFDLAWETKIGDKRYFLSHSGVRKEWFDRWVKNKLFKWDGDDLPPADYVNSRNNLNHNSRKFFSTLAPSEPLFSGWN